MLSEKELEQYDRQLRLSEVGLAGQLKLKNAQVLIVGVGGLGCPVAQYLVAAGIGKIGLIDHDTVDISNIHRQVLFNEQDVGKAKVEVAKSRLEKANSAIEIETFSEALTPLNAVSLFRNYDVIVDATDNFQTKYLINDACIISDKPMVAASIYKFQGQLSVFNYRNGPSYRCLYPQHHLKDNNNCEETGVLGVLPGIMGTMQAAEVIKIILDIGQVLSGQVKIMDVSTMQEQSISFERVDAQIEKVKNSELSLEAIDCELTGRNNQLYLDVREFFEQPQPSNERILRIPLNQLEDRHAEIPSNEEVFVYCQSGIRSKKAIEYLHTNFGYDNLTNVEGGIESLLK